MPPATSSGGWRGGGKDRRCWPDRTSIRSSRGGGTTARWGSSAPSKRCAPSRRAACRCRSRWRASASSGEESSRFGFATWAAAWWRATSPWTTSPTPWTPGGTRLEDVLSSLGIYRENLDSLRRDPKTVKAYLELHIEQGPVLESKQEEDRRGHRHRRAQPPPGGLQGAGGPQRHHSHGNAQGRAGGGGTPHHLHRRGVPGARGHGQGPGGGHGGRGQGGAGGHQRHTRPGGACRWTCAASPPPPSARWPV